MDQAPPLTGFSTAHELCEASVDYVLQNVNTVQYLLQSIEGITGKDFSRERFKCLPADPFAARRHAHVVVAPPPSPNDGAKGDAQSSQQKRPDGAAGGQGLTLRPDQVFAGYMWRRARPDCEKGDIVIVEDHLPQRAGADDAAGSSSGKDSSAEAKKRSGNKKAPGTVKELLEQDYRKTLDQMERNLRHELIHAFDDARGFVEGADCTHQACSEIRAARLSGDCFTAEELKKGRFSFFQGGLQCVRRRATLAVEMNPVCKGFSERAVETVFQQCYSDYEPFAAPVYALGSYGDDKFPNATLKL